MDFIDDNGLINSRPEEIHAENASLWTLEYILVRKLFGAATPKYTAALFDFFDECKIRPGLYDQRDFRDGSQDDEMSHDQLTAISCFSYMMGLKWHKEIWKEIKRQKFRYDNINPDKPSIKRTLHPRDIIFYGILNDVWWCKAAFPIFRKITKISCEVDSFSKNGQPVTSGKLLAFVRTASTKGRNEKMAKLFDEITGIIRRNRSVNKWERVFEVYFGYEKHPIREFIHAQDRTSWLF